MNSASFYVSNLILMTVFTACAYNNCSKIMYILRHQSSQKYGIFQSHPNNSFKLFDNSFPSKLCTWKLMYKIRMYANAIQVSKCLQCQCIILYGNINCIRKLMLVLCAVVLNWYFIIESMIYTHELHQTVWSGDMKIIRANYLVQRLCEMRHK